MYSRLWDDDPDIQKLRVESEAKGTIKTLRHSVIAVVNARFPFLMNLAEQTIPFVDDTKTLDTWLQRIAAANDANMVRRLLSSATDIEE